ncbi:Bax inhibitor-1/YccA family protein [Pedobacter frigiditerrae]|uniref:Bax inhibitor-1/YccA family protein n=1 Tax=Pedobacter frigiditerrae TaxID=2530452 RepID=UPI00292DD460|nr:Bax inhibitor-1/YccA family protein [Pedobacter frigiditerrae]
MEQQNYNYNSDSVFVQEGSVSKKFFANVFLWMFIALGITTLAAYLFASSPELMQYIRKTDEVTGRNSMTILGWIATLAPLGLIFAMGSGLNRFSYATILGAFLLFSFLLGISMSSILFRYEITSVYTCFIAAAGIFGIMAFLGYTTDVDLSKFGPILMVGLVGLIIASVINMIIGSSTLHYILSFVGIAIFTALTAYDVQKIKRIGLGIEENGGQIAAADTKKLVLMAALSLYLDFINIFIYLLQIFGSRK